MNVTLTQPKKILIVEDDQSIRESMAELLESESYEVQTAANGLEAIENLKTNITLPNLILLDLMMPIMDGFQFRANQQLDPLLKNIPVIIMSADGNIREKQSGTGSIAYLKKPTDIDLILQTVKKHIK